MGLQRNQEKMSLAPETAERDTQEESAVSMGARRKKRKTRPPFPFIIGSLSAAIEFSFSSSDLILQPSHSLK